MRRTYTAPVVMAAAVAVAWLLATAALTAAEVQPGTRPIPDELAEIREHVRRANDEIRAVESTLEHRSPHSTVGNTAERIKDKLTGLFTGSPSAPSSTTPGSIIDGAKDTLGRAYEKTRNAIVTPEQYDQFMHRLKVALGTEEPTVWEKVRGAFGYDKPESAMDQLKRAVGPAPVTEQTLTERLSNALSSEPASRRSGLWTRIKSAFGAREPSTLESLTGTDVMHKIKTAVGAEDPTVWESIRGAIEPHRSIMDRVLHPFSSSEGLSISNVVDRVGESLSSLDPTHRDTVMEKIRKAVGLQEPTIWDRLHRRWGTDVQEAVEGTAHVAKEAADKADRFIRGSTYDDVVHRMKVAFGAEDPTLWEKMRGLMESVRNSLPDGVSPEKLYESLTQNLASIDPRNRESYATKIRRAIGLEQPGFVERVRDRIMGGAEQTSDALHHVAYQNVLPKIKEAIGPEKWESMREIFDPQPSLMDKVRGVLGRPSDGGISKQNLLQRATNALHDMDPTRRDSVLEKIKSALGMQTPGILERVQNQFRSGAESATEIAAEAGEAAVDKAREVLHGSTYDNAMHAVKEAIGVEDPTLYERLQKLMSPSESITDKVAHVFKSGTGTDLTRGQLMDKFDAALKSAVPDRYASYSQRVKRALGLEQSSFLDRAKEKLGQLFSGAGSDASAKLEKGTDSIEAALDKLRSSAPEARDKAFEELRRAVADARSQLEGRTKSLYQSLVGGTGGDNERGASTIAQIQSSLEGVYRSFSRGVDNWMNDFRQYTRYPGARGQYLLQSSSTKEGLTYHYVNDNGQEVLDVTGERADEKTFDKLKCLNEFRAQFELAPHSEIPTNSSIQLHSVNRPHVLIRATQTVNGDRYDYQFDDGQETLSVEWGDKQNADRTLGGHEAQHLLGMFRQSHGLSVKPNATPARLRTIRTHREEL